VAASLSTHGNLRLIEGFIVLSLRDIQEMFLRNTDSRREDVHDSERRTSDPPERYRENFSWIVRKIFPAKDYPPFQSLPGHPEVRHGSNSGTARVEEGKSYRKLNLGIGILERSPRDRFTETDLYHFDSVGMPLSVLMPCHTVPVIVRMSWAKSSMSIQGPHRGGSEKFAQGIFF
jgi:hypothetical protein